MWRRYSDECDDEKDVDDGDSGVGGNVDEIDDNGCQLVLNFTTNSFLRRAAWKWSMGDFWT